MSSVCFTVSYLLIMIFIHSPRVESKSQSKCPNDFPCKSQSFIPTFPLTNKSLPNCGLLILDCNAIPHPTLEYGGKLYSSEAVGYLGDSIILTDPILKDYLRNRSCDTFNWNRSVSFPNSPSISFLLPQSHSLYMFKCNRRSSNLSRRQMDIYFNGYKSYRDCENFILYYIEDQNYTPDDGNVHEGCSLIQLPFNYSITGNDLFDKLTPKILLFLKVSEDCSECHYRGGQCLSDSTNNFKCSKEKSKAMVNSITGEGKSKSSSKVKLILIIVLCGVAPIILLTSIVILVIRRCKKGDGSFSSFFSRRDIERGSKYLGVPFFSYSELQKATNNFNSSKELGDGGYGTVYHGKLADGREVAVKRLYEQNCKRIEQFINEIEILTRLRHRNLVTLYGCSSLRNSERLLLVYEYIPNGTLADHLRGERAKHRSLTWPIRINIAIQTANALTYLHSSDIIHRDIKTANILLDTNFCVKVADFGLSRIFPIDVTHVSTTPLGTPGYVDPEYYECYKLTHKSDVYSFGVVLIELISSMPAVDMDRESHEINLANFAMSRILTSAFDALIDPSLGFNTDAEVTRMTTSVAELAFRCLQPSKGMRPTMFDVLETLLEIQAGHNNDHDENEILNES